MLNNEDNINVERSAEISGFEANKNTKDIFLLKKILYVVIGIAGILLFSVIAALIVRQLGLSTDEEKEGAVNFIVYAFLFVALSVVACFDLKKFKNELNSFLPYLIGFGFGVALIVFSIVYSAVVNLFYQTEINENEKSLRSVITIYPILSIIFLGFIGPLCEELTYRVGLFGLIKKPKWVAYVVGVIVFALMHFSFTSPNIINELINLPVYLVSAFLLCLAYDKFGLAASLTAHTANNLFSVSMVIILNLINS